MHASRVRSAILALALDSLSLTWEFVVQMASPTKTSHATIGTDEPPTVATSMCCANASPVVSAAALGEFVAPLASYRQLSQHLACVQGWVSLGRTHRRHCA